MQIVKKKNRRKAISPVLATVILIAITLIAAIAVAGFVFGLFGSFTSSAQVSAAVTSCTYTIGTGVAVCNINLTNTGTSNVVANGCSINIGGVTETGTVTGTASVTAGGAAAAAICTATNAAKPTQASGSQVVGTFSMSNGATVPYSGRWA